MDMLILLRTGQSSSNLIRAISSLHLAIAEKVENLVRFSSEFHEIHQKVMFKRRMRTGQDGRSGTASQTHVFVPDCALFTLHFFL